MVVMVVVVFFRLTIFAIGALLNGYRRGVQGLHI